MKSSSSPRRRKQASVVVTAVLFLVLAVLLPFGKFFKLHNSVDFSSITVDVGKTFEPPRLGVDASARTATDTAINTAIDTAIDTTTPHQSPLPKRTQNNANAKDSDTIYTQKDTIDTEKDTINDTDVDNAKDGSKKDTIQTQPPTPPPTPTQPLTRPPLNVIVFFPDDLSHKSLQDVSGTDYVLTPFLTELAQNGIRFTRNAVTTSVCWMSRATLFTGQYASTHGSLRLKCPRFTLPEYWKDTWVSILQRVGGYHVGHVGKWQYYNSGPHKLFDYSNFFEGRHWYGKLTGSEKAVDHTKIFLSERPKDKPFALTVAFYPPKAVGDSNEPGGQWSPKSSFKELYANKTYVPPYDLQQARQTLPDFLRRGIVTERYQSRWKSTLQYNEGMRNYNALVTEVDAACRQIVDELKKTKGLYENTLIVFTSDNGLLMGNHGLGGKWIAYEESIRVPLIVYDPRMPKELRGRLDNSTTLNIDLASTILGAANIDPPATMQGRDMADLYLPSEEAGAKSPVEQEPWRTDFVYEYPNTDIHETYALINERYKYIRWVTRKYEQLFDLRNDPYELNDLLLLMDDTNATTDTAASNTNKTHIDELLKELRGRYNEIRKERQSPQENGPDWCNSSLQY
mmetsp:Transcript_11751/g.23864  ORF Transcript_11751/g.23864 Transcript_11751/m.23864 type:complete len:626 (+) Transcript_11751:268-2145(+)